MKGITEILQGFAEKLGADGVEAIRAEVMENYRSIDETTKKAERVKELEGELKALEERIAELDGNSDQVRELQDRIAAYEAKEQERQAAAQEDAKRKSFETAFDAALDGREFANGLMRETVLGKAYGLCSEQEGLGAREAIETITKDIDGVWSNPQRDPAKMPGIQDVRTTNERADEEKRGLVARLFGGQE